jgi:ribosomal protein S18 acetylase RimI-like enzyme
MTHDSLEIRTLDADGLDSALNDLCLIVMDSVEDGAAISFMSPMSEKDAMDFWTRSVAPEIVAGRRMVFAARLAEQVVGTVQLITAMPPNQPHRCEIAKMIVHPGARRRGIGRALIEAALDAAGRAGKTLVTLDTRTGDVAEPLYLSVGFEVAGIIPDFAFDPDGKTLHATTYMYRRV